MAVSDDAIITDAHIASKESIPHLSMIPSKAATDAPDDRGRVIINVRSSTGILKKSNNGPSKSSKIPIAPLPVSILMPIMSRQRLGKISNDAFMPSLAPRTNTER